MDGDDDDEEDYEPIKGEQTWKAPPPVDESTQKKKAPPPKGVQNAQKGAAARASVDNDDVRIPMCLCHASLSFLHELKWIGCA